VRRRISISLHSLGDEINPAAQQPRFNRPEDAEGFLQSHGNADAGMDADDESKRRQREELMYWNAVHLAKMEKEREFLEKRPENKGRGSSFDDFLEPDHAAEKGAFVYNTGADVYQPEGGLRNRGVRGLNRAAVYANPFSDEHNIDSDEQRAVDASLMGPDSNEKSDSFSDLYSANEEPRQTRETTATIQEQLIDVSPEPIQEEPIAYPSMNEPLLAEGANNANMASVEENAFASIHAWADNATSSFYSPLPVTPGNVTPRERQAPMSPTFSDSDTSSPARAGDVTPTDSGSVAGSAAEELWFPRSGATSEHDIMSVDGDGISTPGTWTEVGSVVSENDVGHGITH